MDELQHFARQRVFQIGHVSVALDFKSTAGGLHRLRFGFAGKHVLSFFMIGGQGASAWHRENRRDRRHRRPSPTSRVIGGTKPNTEAQRHGEKPMPVLYSSQAANIIFMITSMIGRPEASEAAPY